MEVVLKRDHGKLGKALDVVNVKDGYARNFLMPAGIAVPATEGNRRAVTQVKMYAQKRGERAIKDAKELAGKIQSVPCTIPVKAKNDEEIFGSVGPQEIVDFLAKEGFMIEKSSVELDEPIRNLGVYSVKISLHGDVGVTLKVWVVNEKDQK